MVDAVVSFAVQNLGDFLNQQAVFLQGVRDEVVWLKDELQMMQSCLKDAAEKGDAGDNRARVWISQIRDVAYDTEDVIDKFILKVELKETPTPRRGFLTSSFRKCARILIKENDLYNLAKDIDALKKRVVQISSRREAYGIRNIGDVGEETGGAIEELRQRRRTSSYADEEQAVGFEDVTSSLVGELLKEEPRRCVISILGMGGLGKTTLARKLYHHSQVERTFKHRVWVCVSQEYTIRDLLQKIIITFKPVKKEELELLEKMTEEALERHLRDLLQGHRYLVVIDDVWKKAAWKSLRRAFPENSNASRVIVTTRIKAVAEHSDDRTYLHQLRFLRADESWELFCKKAFPYYNATDGDTSGCPSDLETLGREMVAKCDGLPLAIIVLGGLLSRKQPHEWQTVKEHIWRHLRNDDSNNLSQILALSFNDLPYQLKPCFLYLGLFPEDHVLDAIKLIRLWVAEGFVPARDLETLEEVAEDWLKELVDRSLIQVTIRNWERIMECRVHDLLRDLAVNKGKELNFLHTYEENLRTYEENIYSALVSSTASSYRRQAAHSSIERYVSDGFSNQHLRTLLFFDRNGNEETNIQVLAFIYTRFRLLRVLELESIRFWFSMSSSKEKRSLPNAIGDLIHLRYLGLRGTRINEFPASIFNLQALQTLDALDFEAVVRFPGDICKLKQLRHLIGKFEGLLGFEHLTNLQTLDSVDISSWIKINPLNLINLRKLKLTSHGSRGGQVEELSFDSIGNLRNLQSLYVESDLVKHIPSFQPLSHCRHLFRLRIEGGLRGINLPEPLHDYLPNLKHLHLEKCQLRQDPMPTLEKLPNLMILLLRSIRCIDSRKLICTGNGFPRLEALGLSDLEWLEELEVSEGAMPRLKLLYIKYCRTSMDVPERLKSVNSDDRNLAQKYLGWDYCGRVVVETSFLGSKQALSRLDSVWA